MQHARGNGFICTCCNHFTAQKGDRTHTTELHVLLRKKYVFDGALGLDVETSSVETVPARDPQCASQDQIPTLLFGPGKR